MPSNIVFFWNDVHEEKCLVAASASENSLEIYYTLENRLAQRGGSLTVSSHAWFPIDRPEFIQEVLVLD